MSRTKIAAFALALTLAAGMGGSAFAANYGGWAAKSYGQASVGNGVEPAAFKHHRKSGHKFKSGRKFKSGHRFKGGHRHKFKSGHKFKRGHRHGFRHGHGFRRHHRHGHKRRFAHRNRHGFRHHHRHGHKHRFARRHRHGFRHHHRHRHHRSFFGFVFPYARYYAYRPYPYDPYYYYGPGYPYGYGYRERAYVPPPAYTGPAQPAPAPAPAPYQSSYCREYTKKVVVEGAEQTAYGTACRQADGSWRIVDRAGAPPPADAQPAGTAPGTASYQSSYCREIIKKIVIGGVEQTAYGTACRQNDGSWKVMN